MAAQGTGHEGELRGMPKNDAIPQVLPAMPRREQVEAELVARWRPNPAHVRVAVEDAVGRVLAADVRATYDCPPAQTSGCDGIGVHFDDFAQGIPDAGAWVRDRDYAICDTGDDVPDAFDTVIPVEDLLFNGADGVPFPGERGAAPFDAGFTVAKAPEARGAKVNQPGSSFHEGDVIVAAGARLTPERVSAAVACGAQALEVYARPRVAIIPTGNELVEPGAVPGRGKVINSNAVLLSSYARLLGGEPLVWPIQPDTHEAIAAAVDEALASCDIVLVNAGSSKGSEDCGPHVLAERADVVIQHGQKAAPGMPAMSALTPSGKVMCVIPGPPLAADTAMRWLLIRLVARWYGLEPIERAVSVIMDADIPAGDFEVWRRCVVERGDDGEPHARLLPRGVRLKALGMANAIIRTPRTGDIHAGDRADVLLIADGFCL